MADAIPKHLADRIPEQHVSAPPAWATALAAFAREIAANWPAPCAIQTMKEALEKQAGACLCQGDPAGPGPFSRAFPGRDVARYVDLAGANPVVDDASPHDAGNLCRRLERELHPSIFDRTRLKDTEVRGRLPLVWLFLSQDARDETNAATLYRRLGLQPTKSECYVRFDLEDGHPDEPHVPTALDAGDHDSWEWPPQGAHYGLTQDLTQNGRPVHEVVARPFSALFLGTPHYLGCA